MDNNNLQHLVEKWAPVLDHKDMPAITDRHKRFITAVTLENTVNALSQEQQMLTEAGAGGVPTNTIGGGGIQTFDPILISLIRRAMPKLIAYDICGVQPLTGPTGLIFALRSKYSGQTPPGNTTSDIEALFNEANTAFSGDANNTQLGAANTDPVYDLANSDVYGTGLPFSTANGELLGTTAGADFASMAFSVEKATATAVTRALKAEYTMELAQDLKAVHGLEAEGELSNILSAELLSEINREIIRTVYRSATRGAAYGTTVAGTFDMDVDANGRWSVEKFKGLVFHMEREMNAIAKATRRGKGNIMIVSSDIASALALAGVLDYAPALQSSVNLEVDDTGNTFAGTMQGGRVKVFIDPYFGGSAVGNELVTVGYKGPSPYDAGIFYCPYVPLQMVRAIDPNSFQPKIGFKTRYAVVANPFATTAGDGVVGERNTASNANKYYRIFRVTNLM